MRNTLVQALNTAQRNQLSTNSIACAASWTWTPTIRTTLESGQYAMGLETPWYSNSTVYTAQMWIVSPPGKSYVESSAFHQCRQRWTSVKRSVYVCPHILCLSMRNSLQLVTNTHVNIVDLVDAGGTQVVTNFPSEKALSTYTLATKKIFPRENVHAGGLLQALLRRILHPPDEPKQQRRARKNHQKRSRGHRG